MNERIEFLLNQIKAIEGDLYIALSGQQSSIFSKLKASV
jgi:hypothetical protein